MSMNWSLYPPPGSRISLDEWDRKPDAEKRVYWNLPANPADEPPAIDNTSDMETFGSLSDIKSEILDEAGKIVNGARRKAYGTPENNFERIARFWQAYFDNTGRDVVITAADVSPMMRLMKEARLCETPDHKDSFIDIVGYALTGAEVNKVAPKNTD